MTHYRFKAILPSNQKKRHFTNSHFEQATYNYSLQLTGKPIENIDSGDIPRIQGSTELENDTLEKKQ